MKNKFNIRLFFVFFLVVFSFNFIPSRIDYSVEGNVSASDNMYSFLDSKNPFILDFEIARADVGIGTLTAGGLALLEGVIMPYILGGIGVAGFLYGDTKFRQAEANIRRWASVSAEVAAQLNETASKKKVGDTVTLDELPQNLVQKMAYELGKVSYDGANASQSQLASVLETNSSFNVSSFPSSVSNLSNVFNTYIKPRIGSYDYDVVWYRFLSNGATYEFILQPYSNMYFNTTTGTLVGSGYRTIEYRSSNGYVQATTYPSSGSYSTLFGKGSSTDYTSWWTTYGDIDLGKINYRTKSTDSGVIPNNSVSYYPPSRTGTSDGQSISVPISYPVTVPTDGTWTREPTATVPVSVPDTNVGNISIPLDDVDVIPREIDDTTNPDIPIPSEQTGFWSGLWEWLKAILRAILSIPQSIADFIEYLFVPTISLSDALTYDSNFITQFGTLFDFSFLGDISITPPNFVLDFDMNGVEGSSVPVYVDYDMEGNRFVSDNIGLIRNITTLPLLFSVLFGIIWHFTPKREVD